MSEYRNHTSREVLLSPHYGKHVSAMTGEDLYGKGEIAEELAWRDMQIETLQSRVVELEKTVDIGWSNVLALKEELAAVTKECNGWEMLCGELSPKLTAAMEQIETITKERDEDKANLYAASGVIIDLRNALGAGNER